MDGIAASSSIAVPKGALNQWGESSARKRAIPKLRGMAKSNARNVESRVPTIGIKAPNCMNRIPGSSNKE